MTTDNKNEFCFTRKTMLPAILIFLVLNNLAICRKNVPETVPNTSWVMNITIMY